MNMNFLKKAAVMLAFVSASFGAQKAAAQETPVKKKAQTETVSDIKKTEAIKKQGDKKASQDKAAIAKQQQQDIERTIKQKLQSGELKLAKPTYTDLKNDKGEVIGQLVQENYINTATNKVAGYHTYSRTYEKTTTRTPYLKKGEKLPDAPFVRAAPAPVKPVGKFVYKPTVVVTPAERAKIEAEVKALDPAERVRRNAIFKAKLARNRAIQKKNFEAQQAATPVATPDIKVAAMPPRFAPDVIDTLVSTDSKEKIQELSAVLFQDSVATPEVVKEKRPMKIRLNYGQTTVISPDGSDLYSGKAFKFMELGVTSPTFGPKGTVGELFSIDADIKIGKAPKAEVTADNPGCGCPNALVINGGDNNKLAYRGELSLLVGKDFNLGNKQQFTFGAHVAVGGVIRSKPVITDKPGLAFKKALPEVINAPETFGGFAELRTRAQWNINKNLAVFVEGNYGAQTFKTNTESVYRPNAKVNNPLAEERPYGNGALDKAKTFITGKGGLVWTLGR